MARDTRYGGPGPGATSNAHATVDVNIATGLLVRHRCLVALVVRPHSGGREDGRFGQSRGGTDRLIRARADRVVGFSR